MSVRDSEAQARALGDDDLPRSPAEVAEELIARSGVWRSREQYLATAFMLQPCQLLWGKAHKTGQLASLANREGLAELSQGMRARRLFLHGPGGSGKTFCQTEVVIPVVRQFFGTKGVKAIAASNSAAERPRRNARELRDTRARGNSCASGWP